MRKIEKEMVNALKAAKDMRDGNTVVAHDNPRKALVYLHGNLIAEVTDSEVRVTLAGWPTPTTRSRIHAICVAFTKSRGIGQRKGRQYLDLPDGTEMEIDAREWYTLPRVQGGFHA